MIKNYLKIAWRNIVRHKGYSLLNVSGLAVGIGSCLLLFLVIRYELSFDRFQQNAKRIYRVVTKNIYSDGIGYEEGIAGPATASLRAVFPQFENTSEIFSSYGSELNVPGDPALAAAGEKKFIEDIGVFFVDPEFFKIFDGRWLAGTADVLKEPNMIVLDSSHAVKYFGNWQQAMGKQLKMDNALTLKVGAITADYPSNTDFPMKVMVSFITLKNNANLYSYLANEWGASTSNHQVFILLPPNVTESSINAQLVSFVKKYFSDNKTGAGGEKSYFLQPLGDMHFDKRFSNLGDHTTSKGTIWTLALVGVFILLMASINFINLSTAQAVGRSREVGIRKVLGSDRRQLILQFMGETAIIVCFSTIVAVLLAKLALPYLKQVASVPDDIGLLTRDSFLFMGIIAVVVTILSGFYPAMVLSGFKPALALKSRISGAKIGGISMRRVLVVGQFVISQVLIIGTLVAVRQMSFVRDADLGFNKDAVLILDNIADSAGIEQIASLKRSIQQVAGVRAVSFNTDPPSSGNNWGTNFYFNNSMRELGFETNLKMGDADYFSTFGLRMIAGRAFDVSDTLKEVVINETLMKKLGMKDAHEAVGKTIRIGGRAPWVPIVGVVQDFKTNSLREQTRPIALFSRKQYYARIAVKLSSSNFSKAMASIQTVWEKAFPNFVYAPHFLDEKIAEFYEQENQLERLYKIFAGLAIFISCLGLYGLASFLATQKTKEVGVRKVLGASVGSIIYLFSKEFTILIALAFLVAAPVAYFLMNSWLQHFAYRITPGIGVFVLAIASSLLIAWITVGYKALRAATVNPIQSLRSE